jgi:hypothetical protein
MTILTDDDAIDFVMEKYGAKLRHRGEPAKGPQNQGIRSDDDKECENILREACEELLGQLRALHDF